MQIAYIINLIVSAFLFIFVIASTYYFYNIRNGNMVIATDLTFMFYTGLFLSFVAIIGVIASIFGLITGDKKKAKATTTIVTKPDDASYVIPV